VITIKIYEIRDKQIISTTYGKKLIGMLECVWWK